MWIQNLVTILENLCTTEKTSQNDVTYIVTGVCRQYYSVNNPLFPYHCHARCHLKHSKIVNEKHSCIKVIFTFSFVLLTERRGWSPRHFHEHTRIRLCYRAWTDWSIWWRLLGSTTRLSAYSLDSHAKSEVTKTNKENTIEVNLLCARWHHQHFDRVYFSFW